MNSLFNGSTELFEAYIALIAASLEADVRTRRDLTVLYEDAVAAARATCEESASRAASAYVKATGGEVARYQRLRAESQTLLNEEITAANALYQAAEIPVFANIGTHADVTALVRRRDALIFAAGELDSPELGDDAGEQYEEARRELFARRDAALAEARSTYQREMAAMHERHQARLRQYDSEEKAIVAPFANQRERTLNHLQQVLDRAIGLEEFKASRALAQLEHKQFEEGETRRRELALLRRENFSAAARQRFLDYCERSTQLLKDRAY